MMERKFVQSEKDEFSIKEFVEEKLGKGKISDIKIERTPVGEKITIYTSKPGLIIGTRGEKIRELTEVLKKRFKLENPKIDILEIEKFELDARSVADEIASKLERFGQTRFKIIAYRMLERIKQSKALGAEIVLSGKLPSERAKSWRFAFGRLKKTGDMVKVVRKAKATAKTVPGTVGVKVLIVPPNAFEETIKEKVKETEEIKK